MAAPRITDNEMRYFQFKARQLFLLQKEDYEWEEFCKKNVVSSSAGKKTVKDVGIQAASKTLTNSGRKVIPVQSNQPKEPLPEALNFIKAKLERIDLALSEIKTVSTENEKATKTDQQIPGTSRTFSTNWSSPNGSRKQLIQESLRQNLQRLQSSAVWKPKSNPSANIKLKNSGYMIPHNLQKHRTVARKAYLASLSKTQEKPNLNPDIPRKKTMQVKSCQQKRASNMKAAQKSRYLF
ncbi:uncharacterized protein LOC118184737 [Stegodyphus dumicola]|uniref:uncharacterized protein LOC118184737 n=1 Tax=Stegodyphus dumicola TaxID=202533 RepID=UPI0015AD3F16|nr:uncharacterized protein LOC118184737 [Stegodyphus dumicola]